MEVKIVEYSKTAAALGELRQRYEKVLFPVSTTAGMKDAIAARKELRDIRVGLEKMRKEIKAPALERCRLIDEEAKAITIQIEALENPIDAQIKAEEQRKEREKQERERIERERIEAIRKMVEGIRSLPVAMSGESAAEIAAEIEALEQFTPGEEFAEFVEDAVTAKAGALDALRAMHERQAAQEAAAEAARLEAERLAAERAELERQRAEAAAKAKAEADRLAAERAALEAARAEFEQRQRAHEERERAEKEAQEAAVKAAAEAALSATVALEDKPVLIDEDGDVPLIADTSATPEFFDSEPAEEVSQAPEAIDLILTISEQYGIDKTTARDWLVQRAAEIASIEF